MASASSDVRTVLIVDDSAFIRRVVRDVIDASPDFRVVGEAANGTEAIQSVQALDPDVVTMDIDMPGPSGLETLGRLMREYPRPVVMLSGQESPEGVELTIRALELGAVDFVRKPSSADSLDESTLQRRLLQALRSAAGVHVTPPAPLEEPSSLRKPRPASALRTAALFPAHGAAAQHLIAIAASTGGPRALAELVPRLSLSSGAAVVIVQHMPEHFTASLAQRLGELGPRPVVETSDDALLLAGVIYVARGGRHTRVARTASGEPRLMHDDGPPVHAVRPAADPLFESAAAAFGPDATAVVLTGMGRDGAQGCSRIRQAGGMVIVQDPSTCVVGGMGASVLAFAGADLVAALADIPAALASRGARSPAV
jgi:two-component system chemotaxis response regulator CheB